MAEYNLILKTNATAEEKAVVKQLKYLIDSHQIAAQWYETPDFSSLDVHSRIIVVSKTPAADKMIKKILNINELKALPVTETELFSDLWRRLRDDIHETMVKNGFADQDASRLLMHVCSEASECWDALREGREADAVIELADIIIAAMHFEASIGFDLPDALFAKAATLKQREFKHGKIF
jgi:hypothetical protein